MTTAPLLIDIQNNYFPGGKVKLEGSLPASLRARKIMPGSGKRAYRWCRSST